MSSKLFKVGDDVRVKNNLVVDKGYGGYLLLDDMVIFLGVKSIIERVSYRSYRIEGSSRLWTDEMLEPVKKARPMKIRIKYHDGLYGLRCEWSGIDIVGFYYSISNAKRGLNRFIKKLQEGNYEIEVKK